MQVDPLHSLGLVDVRRLPGVVGATGNEEQILASVVPTDGWSETSGMTLRGLVNLTAGHRTSTPRTRSPRHRQTRAMRSPPGCLRRVPPWLSDDSCQHPLADVVRRTYCAHAHIGPAIHHSAGPHSRLLAALQRQSLVERLIADRITRIAAATAAGGAVAVFSTQHVDT